MNGPEDEISGFIRDKVVDFVNYWSEMTDITVRQIVIWIAISAQKFNEWKRRYGKINEHNAWIPRDTLLEDWEKKAILDYYVLHPDEGYRRLDFMMLDEDIVAVSPSSVYRVLFEAGVMRKWNRKPSKKETGFVQPLKAHEFYFQYLTLFPMFLHYPLQIENASASEHFFNFNTYIK